LNRQIAESRFAVLPSHAYETLGKSILESYAHSRAVVASDLGSRREFVRHGETGLLYPPGDVSQLADALSFLSNRPDLAWQMGRAGRREFVRTRHAPEDHYAALAGLYEKLVLAKQVISTTHRALQSSSTPATKPKLKIAFIGGRGVIGKYSGIESYYEQVGQRLAAARHDVTIYCRSYFTPPQATHQGMRLVRLPAIPSKHFDTALHTLLSTLHVLFRRCDIVHYHTLGPSLFSIVLRLAGMKTVVTVQGLDCQRKKWGRISSAVLRMGEKAAALLSPQHHGRLAHAPFLFSRSVSPQHNVRRKWRHFAGTASFDNNPDLGHRAGKLHPVPRPLFSRKKLSSPGESLRSVAYVRPARPRRRIQLPRCVF
jgi:glycosyltransferase involved in cell wall biosynthesis